MRTFLRLFRSSHLRNVALATLLSGMLLSPLAVFYARSVRFMERNRLDTYIRDLSLLHLSHAGVSAEAWRNVDRGLAAVNLTHDMSPPMILVRDSAGKPLYRSPQWTIDAKNYRLLTAAEMARRYGEYMRRYLQGTPNAAPAPVTMPAPPPTFKYFNWTDAHGRVWRVGVTGTPEVSLALAMDWTTRKAAYVLFVRALIVALPSALLLIAGISYFLSYRALRPVRQLQATAERITAQGLGERIPPGQDLEFEGLVNVFNDMLDRLERSFNQANQFSAGAAHELKTPLSVLQAELERGIQDAPYAAEEQERYSRLLEQVQRLKTITHRLLLLASVDAGGLRLQKEPFDLRMCVLDACEDAAILAPDITLSTAIPAEVSLAADVELLPQVISNLVTNATTHNEPGGNVMISLEVLTDRIVLTVSNTGPGIPDADRAQLFTRFYRADRSRSRVRGGSGLGLSLARDIARAHGGDITLVASDATRTTFRLELPRTHAG